VIRHNRVFFCVSFFLRIIQIRHPHKTIFFTTTKKPYNPCQNPQFSDVIALAGNSGLPAAFRTLTLQKQVPKNMTNRNPLNCRLKSQINRLFSRNTPLKRYFPFAWTPLPREPGNGSLNGQSEPVLHPEYLMSRASGSTLTLSGFWWCQTFLWTPCEGKNPKEFSIGQGVIDTQTESELGEYGNRRLENARIRGVVNLVSAGVWGGFYRSERGVGIEANGKLVR